MEAVFNWTNPFFSVKENNLLTVRPLLMESICCWFDLAIFGGNEPIVPLFFWFSVFFSKWTLEAILIVGAMTEVPTKQRQLQHMVL